MKHQRQIKIHRTSFRNPEQQIHKSTKYDKKKLRKVNQKLSRIRNVFDLDELNELDEDYSTCPQKNSFL